MSKIQFKLLPSTPFLDGKGKFKLDEALIESARIAGICYSEDGYEQLKSEPVEKTEKRRDDTLRRDHHSIYDHFNLNIYIKNIPKALAMVINNEKQYNTSEKSGRYASITKASVGEAQKAIYDKWVNILKIKIESEYGNQLSKHRIKTLAQENARYLVTVFTLSEMVYSVPLGQVNKILGFMETFINSDAQDEFSIRLKPFMEQFILEAKRLNFSEERLQSNHKNRSLSIFGKEIATPYYGDTYVTNYQASFTHFAQVLRHRTLKYNMILDDSLGIYIPPIIMDDPILVKEWLNDYELSKGEYVQGQLVTVNEAGTYDDFVLKLKERLCNGVQLEPQQQTIETLKAYREALLASDHRLASDIEQYTHGARCTFKDFVCTEDCHSSEGKRLVRKI